MSPNPDIDYGNAVISAYNDYLIDEWLSKDERYKGATVINHSDPEYAAKEIMRVGGRDTPPWLTKRILYSSDYPHWDLMLSLYQLVFAFPTPII